MIKGQVIGGEFNKILVRQKSDENIELGELLVCEEGAVKILMQAYDLQFGSQISSANLELISGMHLEEDVRMDFSDPKLKNYKMAFLKSLVTVSTGETKLSKNLPGFFSTVREIKKDDLTFLSKPRNSLMVGDLRSGSRSLDFPIFLDGEKVFSHHVLVPATTGRGKSNLTSCILWDNVDKDYAGVLVLDPHDEYFGRDSIGLKDHPSSDRVVYYTPRDVPSGQRTLKINLKCLRPAHFNGVLYWSDPQKDALLAYFRQYGVKWIESIVLEKPLNLPFNEATLAVVRRRIMSLLDLDFTNGHLSCRGVFDVNAGESIISDIASELEQARTVVVDTSLFSGAVEVLVGSLIANYVFNRYKYYKSEGLLLNKPVVSIVLEEAPRVLGKEALESGPNAFSTIAREGRKFKVGLFAITQLPSLIPREILANMNTKIVLGIEMAPERQAVIESAAQDLSADSRAIASLDKGEAIVTSNFSRFAIPVKIPLFTELAKSSMPEKNKVFFGGVKRD